MADDAQHGALRTSVDEMGRQTKSQSPLKKLTDKHVLARMFARGPKTGKPSVDESFDMVPDFDSDEPGDRKRSREDFSLVSPQRKQPRSDPPARPPPPPTAYRLTETAQAQLKHSLPPRKDSIPPALLRPATPQLGPASIPLPVSPPKSSASGLDSPPTPPIKQETHSPQRLLPALHLESSTPRQASRGVLLESSPPSPTSERIYAEFDRLFAEFLHPPNSAHSQLPTPGLTSASSSSYSLPNPHSRPFTPLSPYPPPDPTRLESAITTLSQVIRFLQGAQTDHSTYIVRQADLEARVQSLQAELSAVRGENVRLEVDVRREREERARAERAILKLREEASIELSKAEQERAEAMKSFKSLQAEMSSSTCRLHDLSAQLATAQRKNEALESHTKALEAEVARLNSAFGIVKADYQAKETEMRTRMEEAEFMHLALKESGARLGRELEGAKRKCSELEKKGRGGFI